MKIKRSRLEEIVKEEFANVVRELLEADGVDLKSSDDEDARKKKEPVEEPKVPDPKKKDDAVKAAPDADMPDPEEPIKQDAPETEDSIDAPDVSSDDEEIDVGEDPADDKLSKDVSEPDEEDKPGDNKIGSDLEGKQVQSITLQDSQVMKGAKEIVIQFQESPDPLHILFTKSGEVKFLYKNELHNDV